MSFDEFKVFFLEEAKNNKINVDESKISLFYTYMKEIINWNDKINLTAIMDEKEFIIKHFIDSLIILEDINNNDKVIDIGTGAGFPGIPLKIVNEKMDITLVDSVNKKLNVIREITNDMKIDNLEIVHSRAEDLAQNSNYREKYDIAVARAVSNLSTISEYMLPFVKVGGKIICMKGPNFTNELEESKNAIKLLGGKIKNIKTVLISGEFERNIIIIEKISDTPLKYPRAGGKALKDPLK